MYKSTFARKVEVAIGSYVNLKSEKKVRNFPERLSSDQLKQVASHFFNASYLIKDIYGNYGKSSWVKAAQIGKLTLFFDFFFLTKIFLLF